MLRSHPVGTLVESLLERSAEPVPTLDHVIQSKFEGRMRCTFLAQDFDMRIMINCIDVSVCVGGGGVLAYIPRRTSGAPYLSCLLENQTTSRCVYSQIVCLLTCVIKSFNLHLWVQVHINKTKLWHFCTKRNCFIRNLWSL